MMHDTRYGIVLRIPGASRYTISLFDNKQGRMRAMIPESISLVHGQFISYQIESWRQTYKLRDLQCLKLPASWVYTDILFLHHVLEIALFFLPEHSCSSSVFQLCAMLYDDQVGRSSDCALLKKLFLGKFFALLGVYPEGAYQKDAQLFHLFSDSWKMDAQFVENSRGLQEKLQSWLLGCIQTHPRASTFTTIRFLYMPF